MDGGMTALDRPWAPFHVEHGFGLSIRILIPRPYAPGVWWERVADRVGRHPGVPVVAGSVVGAFRVPSVRWRILALRGASHSDGRRPWFEGARVSSGPPPLHISG